MTQLAKFEDRAIAAMRQRHLDRARNELSDIIESATTALRRLDAGQVPDINLIDSAVTYRERIRLVQAIDEIRAVLDSDQRPCPTFYRDDISTPAKAGRAAYPDPGWSAGNWTLGNLRDSQLSELVADWDLSTSRSELEAMIVAERERQSHKHNTTMFPGQYHSGWRRHAGEMRPHCHNAMGTVFRHPGEGPDTDIVHARD